MGQYVVRRLAQGLVVVVAVMCVVFVATRLIGDPVSVLLPIEASEEQREALRDQLGLNRPLAVQFADYARGALQLDFGDSLWQRSPALDIVLERLPATLQLLGWSMAAAFVLGLLIGVVAALRPGGVLDRANTMLSLLWLSMPQFWLGLILIVVFAVSLRVLPSAGMGSPAHLILPVVSIALPAAGRLALVVRASLVEELSRDYVQMDRARGFRLRRIVGRHALRNILVPYLTFGGFEVVRTLAGHSVVVETVFAWPGLGLLAVQAIERRDLVLIQAVVAVIAVLVVALNLFFDILNRSVDPRISASRARS